MPAAICGKWLRRKFKRAGVMQNIADSWEWIGYEVKMFNATYKIFFDQTYLARLPYALKNAVEESAVLHTRILCDVFLNRATKPDDIDLSRLFLNWSNVKYKKIRALKDKLETLYGKNNKPGTPCWTFNKMLAHPTSHRGTEYNYRKILCALRPAIQEIVVEVECLRGTRFPLRFLGQARRPNP
jgi:hypothetical protein